MRLAARLSDEGWLVNRIESSNSGGSFARARASARPNPNDWNPRCSSPTSSHSEYTNPRFRPESFGQAKKVGFSLISSGFQGSWMVRRQRRGRRRPLSESVDFDQVTISLGFA